MGNIQDSILKAIDTIAMRRIDQLKLDKTITAIIKSPVGVVNGKKVYKVEYDGGYFNAIAQNVNDAYLPKMAVYVQIPEGDFSKEKFILGKASSIATGAQQSVVAATANNYGIIGKNAISSNKTFAVRSYHDPVEENINEQSIEHRYNFLYGGENGSKITINNGDLLSYKNNATAIMIRAEFMTKLSQEQRQQVNGEYGLVFNLVFKNLAAGIGETQGEVFDYYAKIIKQNNITLLSKDVQVKGEIAKTNFRGENGSLDGILNDIQALINSFKQNQPDSYTIEMSNAIDGYLINLQDMVNASSDAIARSYYNSWRAEKIGQPAEKVVSYFLSSNQMIGNPFYFNFWSSQYAVFEIDLENFLRVESVLLYKEGFEKSSVKETEDILVRNLQLYMMKPLTDYNGQYQLKVEANETGMIFEDTINPAPIKLNATLVREFYEDLTGNADTSFYWFEQNRSVTSANHASYHVYGGLGWALIENNYASNLTVSENNAQAYENHYRCAAVYMGEETPIVLRYDFIIYNNKGQKFVLVSNMGETFNFDAGTPTITVYKDNNKDGKNLIELNGDNKYRFSWAIIDNNNQKTFLQKQKSLSYTDISVENILNNKNMSKLLQGVELYQGNQLINLESGNWELATRLKYPMSNVASNSNITFEVYIGYNAAGQEPYNSIGKATLKVNNQNVDIPNSYRIFIENGDQVFQYDEYGNAPTEGKLKDPQEVLPLVAHLFTPANVEISNISFRTKWYFPTRDSLIIYKDGKLDPATNKNNIFEGTEVHFDIQKLYNYDAIDNQIICQVTIGNRVFEKETNFYFGKVGDNGTNGTDMIAKIVPQTDDILYSEQPLTINMYNNKSFFNTQSPNSSVASLSITNNNTGFLKAELYQKSEKINISNVKWNIAGNTNVGSNKNGRDFKLNNNIITWQNFFDSTHKYRQYVLKAEINYENKTYYAFYSLPVIIYTQNPSSLSKNRIGINKKTYLKDILYNTDGRNPIYSHNQGLELINIPYNCTITWTACGGYNNNENNPTFKLLPSKDAKKSEARLTWTTTQKMIYVLPDDSISGDVTNNYIKAEVKRNNSLIATVYAPINMTLNTFGLASLNAWDGQKIDINEDGNYIMAPQIGAGEKDGNNRFTGILMGKDNESRVGLFGYAKGLQSIFLDANTGNATFGLSQGKYLHTNGEYFEGRIELIPGGVSTIGGWRFGKQSLYYTSSGNLGNKYTDSYATHHTKDINHSDQGILISANPSYISIKGKVLTSGDVSDSADTQITAGDSLEIQLDPKNTTMFGIFRHHNNARTLLSGINTKGQLVANRMQQAPINNTNSASSALGIDTMNAFGSTNGKYIGLNVEAGKDIGNTISFFKAFVDKTSIGTSSSQSTTQLYITGGANTSNGDYARPVSMHGNSVNLYALGSGSRTATSTDARIGLSQNDIIQQLGNTSFKLNRTGDNSLTTAGKMAAIIGGDLNITSKALNVTSSNAMTINSGTSNNRQTLTVNSAAQSINSSSNISINATGAIGFNSSNVTNINSTGNIKLTRNNGSNVEIQSEWIYNKINDNNMLALTSNTGQTTQLKSDTHIAVTSNKRLTLTGRGNDDAADYGIVLTSNDSANKSVTLKLRPHYSGGSSHPFDLALGNAGNVFVEFDTNAWDKPKWYTGMNQEIAMGLKINGNYLGNDYGLRVDNNASIGGSMYAGGDIHTNWGGNGIRFSDSYYEENDGTYSYAAGGSNLEDLIRACLRAAKDARWAASNVQTNLTNLTNSLGSAAYANTGDFRPNWWTPSAADVGAVATGQRLTLNVDGNNLIATGHIYTETFPDKDGTSRTVMTGIEYKWASEYYIQT